MMKIQLALDDITIKEALILCHEVIEYIDIIEVGTPMIIEYGVEAIRKIRKEFPEVTITADPKIVDAGYYEAKQCFNAGANIVTVLGVSHDETFEGAIKAAKEFEGHIMADMITVDDTTSRGKELISLGVEYITVHTAVDVQAMNDSLAPLKTLTSQIESKNIGVAGGVNKSTVKDFAEYNPEIIIIGSGLTNVESPKDEAREIKEIVGAR